MVLLRELPLADPGRPDLRSGRRFLVWLIARQRGVVAGGVLFGVLWMVAQAAVPAALGRAIDDGVAAGNTATTVGWALTILGLGLVQAASGMMRHRYAVTSYSLSQGRVHQLAAQHIAHLGADAQRQLAGGTVAAVTGPDAHGIAHALDVIPRLTGSVVAVVGVTLILAASSPVLGAVVAVGVPVVALGFGILAGPLAARESERRERLGEASALAADTVSGLRVLRGFGGEHAFVDRFAVASQSVRYAAVDAARLQSTLEALQVALPGLFLVLVTWLGARLAADGTITIGTLVACYAYTAFLLVPLRTFAETARKYAGAIVSAERITSLLRTTRSDSDPLDPLPPPATPDGLLVDPDSGLHVPAGTFLAVAADSPDDATALVDRLGRYADTDATLAGVPLRALAVADVRARILVSDKDPTLLSGTIRDTLDAPLLGRPLSIDDALAAASAHDVVDAVADGLDDELPERGRSLSGGQRQRLALARALRADPPILVLDEPTSAVDAHTEARIAAGIHGLRTGRTTVVTTTSPLVLDRADRVALLIGGTVAAEGTHRDLLSASAAYRELVTRGEDA